MLKDKLDFNLSLRPVNVAVNDTSNALILDVIVVIVVVVAIVIGAVIAF